MTQTQNTETPADSASLRVELVAQPRLEPGAAGWWKVWGASIRDVRAGDAIATAGAEWDYVQDTFTAKAEPVRYGFVIDGARCTIGALVPVVVLRRGTHNTLAASVR